LRAAYRRINDAVVRGLRELGVAAELALEGPIAHLDAGPCFAGPAPDEVVAGGRKLVGSAQARLEGRLLQHGSLLLSDDQGLAAGHRLHADDPESGRAPATLTGLLGCTPDPTEVAGALCRGFEAELPGEWCGMGAAGWPPGRGEDTLPGGTREHERTLRERYVSESWTWRR
jgi:lipoate-protein ligase A